MLGWASESITWCSLRVFFLEEREECRFMIWRRGWGLVFLAIHTGTSRFVEPAASQSLWVHIASCQSIEWQEKPGSMMHEKSNSRTCENCPCPKRHPTSNSARVGWLGANFASIFVGIYGYKQQMWIEVTLCRAQGLRCQQQTTGQNIPLSVILSWKSATFFFFDAINLHAKKKT